MLQSVQHSNASCISESAPLYIFFLIPMRSTDRRILSLFKRKCASANYFPLIIFLFFLRQYSSYFSRLSLLLQLVSLPQNPMHEPVSFHHNFLSPNPQTFSLGLQTEKLLPSFHSFVPSQSPSSQGPSRQITGSTIFWHPLGVKFLSSCLQLGISENNNTSLML